jgi:TolA-binding protein
MTTSCPDDLLVGARRGTLSADEARTLNGHLATCATCRLSDVIGRSVGPLPPVDDEDDAMALRLLARVPSQIVALPRRPEPKRFVAPWRWPRWAAVASVVAVAGVSSAAIWTAHRRATQARSAAPAAVTEAPSRAKPAPPMAPVALPALPAPTVAPVAPSRVALVRPTATAEPAVHAPAPDPEQLLRDANEARRARRIDDAVRAYRALQTTHPSSKEAVLSHLSLGNLELERGAFAGALAQFDAYLRGGGAEMGEEALLGKARALAGLGRADEERAVWRDLQARYPRSEYLWRARQRLEELDRGGAP